MRHHHICNTAFPIAHNTTIRPYRVRRVREQQEIRDTFAGAYGHLDEMMLYAHVPFCHTRCQFCEYTVVNPKQGRDEDVQSTYFKALWSELDMYAELLHTRGKRLVGFDIGGGTPSMARTEHIAELMQRVEQRFDRVDWEQLEVSIETTPKIAAAEPDKMRAYYDMGIRRISMGVQTTDFTQAQEMNRDDANASVDYLHRAVANIRAAGFRSFNIDLMYGFPLRASRTDDPWLRTVQDTIDLGPEHITLYRMRYKGTLMAHLADRVKLDQVNRQEGDARALLNASGFVGLTGKNTFSRVPGNSGCSDYLDKRVRLAVPYIGIGLGAQSFSHYSLSYNLGAVTKRLEQYVRSLELRRIPVQDLYHLSREAAIAKMASVSFYYGGIDLRAFESCFRASLHSLFPSEVDFVLKYGLMELDHANQRLQMTKLGKQCFGGVVALFYSPSVKNYILNLQGGERFLVDPVHALAQQQSPFQPLPDEPAPVRRRVTRSAAAATATPVVEQASSPSALRSSILPSSLPSSLSSSSSSTTITTAQPFSSSTAAGSSRSMSTMAHRGNHRLHGIDVSQPFEFGNILFSGPCNQRCPFCIGHRLVETPNNLRQFPPENLDGFVECMRASRSSKIIMTGTRTDPQLYKYEEQLVRHLRHHLPGVHISLHTNGLLAAAKLAAFSMYDSCTMSINSFQPETYRKLHGVKQMPDVAFVLANAPHVPLKLSCVVTEENVEEIDQYLATAANLGIRRVALRHLYGEPQRWPASIPALAHRTPIKYHQSNPVYELFDGRLQVTHWIFDKTSGRSLNLFSDGTLSAEYLLTKAPNQQQATASSTV